MLAFSPRTIPKTAAYWRLSLAYEVYVVGDQESCWPEVVAVPVDRERWAGLKVRLLGSFASEEDAFRLFEQLLVADCAPAAGGSDR